MIRKFFAWLLILSCSLQYAKAQTFINDKVDIIAGPSQYLLNEVVYKPANFNTSTKYPLVLFFHGTGEAGTDVNKLYNTGLPKVLKSGYKPSFDFIMVAPQHTSYSLDPKSIQQVIDETLLKFPNIDQNRIYLTGLSAGGYPVYGSELDIDTTLAKKIAGIVIMSGATQDADKTHFAWWKTSKTPLWAVVGNSDPSYRDQNQYMVDQINAQVPGLASITIRDGVGHGGWDDVYDGTVKTTSGKTMWDWLYQFSRNGSTSKPPTNTPPVASAGTDQTITLPTAAAQLSGSGSDADGSITSYTWSKISGPAQFTMSTTSAARTSLTNLAQGSYTFRLTVTDNQGATASDDINIVVNAATVVPPTTAKSVKVNLYGGSNAYSNSQWNNWNTKSTSSGSLKFSDGTASSINAVLTQNAMSDNGSAYSASMAPSEVLRYSSYSTSSRTLTISGLDNSKTYDLELYASRNGSTNNSTRFTVGGSSISIKTDNNAANKAAFTSLVPAGGQITVMIDRLNTYNYLNGFTLTVK